MIELLGQENIFLLLMVQLIVLAIAVLVAITN